MTYSQAWLEDPAAIRGVLVEATVYDVLNNIDKVIYLSNIGYMTEDSLTSYLPIIKGGVTFSETLSLDGDSSISFGDISISNYNGEYDEWLDIDKYIWYNRPIQVYIGDPMWVCTNLASIRTKFELVFDGLIADIDTKSRESIDFKVRDSLEKLNAPITENTLGKYGIWVGNQPNTEIIKPLIFGEVFNVEPILVNNAAAEYMLFDSYVHIWVSNTTSGSNLITCDSTKDLIVNAPIIFSDNALSTTEIGGISPNATYYVKSITANSNTFTISTTVGGSTVPLLSTEDSKLVGRSLTTNRSLEAIIEIRDNGFPIYNTTTLAGYTTTTTSSNSSLNITTNITKTSSLRNTITALSTKGFSSGMPIVFSGTTIGNLVSGTVYYVKEVYGPFEFSIYAALTPNIAFVVNNAVGSFTATVTLPNVLVCTSTVGLIPTKKILFAQPVGGLLANKVYYVKQVHTSNIFSVSDTVNGLVTSLTTSANNLNIGTLIPSIIPNLTTGTFSLNNKPAGTLTASVQGIKNSVSFPSATDLPVLSKTTYVNNIASIIALIVTQYGKPETRLQLSDIDASNFYNFSRNFLQTVGIFISDRTNVLEVCQQILSSVGSQIYMTRSGKLQILTVGIPTADPIVNISMNDILHHSLAVSQKIEAKPAVKLGYNKNWTIQPDLLTAIPETHKALFSTEWYTKIYTDNTLKTLYKTSAMPTQKDTLLLEGAEATAEAIRLTNLYGKPKFVYKFTGISKLLSLKLGQAVTLTHPRFGLHVGKPGQVISLSPNWLNSTIEVEVLI